MPTRATQPPVTGSLWWTPPAETLDTLEVESLKHVAPTVHGHTIYGETTVLEKRDSASKDDRGVVHVETKGCNQDGTLVCILRRKVMVPRVLEADDHISWRG